MCILSQGTLSQHLPYITYTENNQSILTEQRNRPCFQVPFENLYEFFHHYLELNISDSVFYCYTDTLEMEVIQGQLTVASGFWTARFSKEVWRKVSWSLEMVLLRSIFIILSSKPRFLYKVQASRGFLFSPNTFILFRFQTAASSCCCQILDTCQMKEMLCGVSCWFLVHRGWRGMHWQKGAGMGSSAAGGGQQRRKKARTWDWSQQFFPAY